MKFSVYNLAGTMVREQEIDTLGVEQIKVVPALVHQVTVAALANQRQAIAHTKTRGEVAGGGKKPWKQKGTGRARHGSIRSPLWVGGGITFGPRSNRNFSKALPQTMRRRALAMALADKLKAGGVVLLETLHFPIAKTKHAASLLAALPLAHTTKKQARAIVAFNKEDGDVTRVMRNMNRAYAVRSSDLDVVSLVKAKALVTTPAGLETLLQRCATKSKSVK